MGHVFDRHRAVAQLARVPVSKTGGWGFESLLPCGIRFVHGVRARAYRAHAHTGSSRHNRRGDASTPMATETRGETATKDKGKSVKKRTSPLLFYRQVVAELRK